MPFLIGLLSPVFTQRMSPFNSLLLPLATAQPVLMRHRGHQVDKHVIDGGYHGAGDWVSLRRVFICCEGSLSDSACHEVDTSRRQSAVRVVLSAFSA